MYDSWGNGRLARRGPWLALVVPTLLLVLTAPFFLLYLLLDADPAGPPASADLVAATDEYVYLNDAPFRPPWLQPPGADRGWEPIVSPGVPPAPATMSCTGAVCYRVLPGTMTVESSADAGATWVPSWRIGDPDRRRLAAARDRDSDNITRDFVSVAVAVQPLPAGGHVVVVANKLDGYAVRDVTGAWTRVGFPATGGAAVVISRDRPVPLSVIVGLAALLGALVIVIGAERASARGWGRTTWRTPVILAVGALALLVPAGFDRGSLGGIPIPLLAAAVVVIECAIYAVFSTLRVLNDGPGQDRWSLQVWAGGLLTATAVGTAGILWYAQSLPGRTATAAAVTTVAFVLGAWIAVTAARRIPHPALATPASPVA